MALAIKLAAHRAVTEMIDEPRCCCSTTSSPSSTHNATALAKTLPADTQTLISSARPEDVPVEGEVWRVGDGVQR